MTPLRIGTRGSPLARWQAEWVAARLRESGQNVEMVLIVTQGDREQVGAIGQIGGQGVFTKEIQRALLAGEVDLAVHSLKDLPTEPVQGLSLAAVPERGPAGDVLLSRDRLPFEKLPQGALVGTGSSRRRSQLWHVRPDLRIEDVRGNVETRVRKLTEGQFDALILAEAGITRLGLAEHITQVLPRSLMLPAVGQGALGIEARSDDVRVIEALARLDHPPTHQSVLAERAMLFELRGGCLAPVGAWGRVETGRLYLSGVVLSLDGRARLEASANGSLEEAEAVGSHVAQELLSQGAAELISNARNA